MRVSPIGFAFDRIELVLRESAQSAQVSHNHPEGIKGAQATALAVFFARTGYDKESIRKELSVRFNYCLSHRVDEIRPRYHFDVSCQGTVPQAIVAFLDSTDFEDAIRNAISLGGDSDTLGCITGGIAQAYYWEIPKYIVSEVRNRLPEQFLQTIDEFEEQFMTL